MCILGGIRKRGAMCVPGICTPCFGSMGLPNQPTQAIMTPPHGRIRFAGNLYLMVHRRIVLSPTWR